MSEDKSFDHGLDNSSDRFGKKEDVIVFMIGNSEEWDDTRDNGGDEELYKCFQDLVPDENITYVKDDDCTKRKCEEELKQLLLKRSKPNDTLVFYYCGHGIPSGFSTLAENKDDDKIWQYDNAIQCIHQHFRGNKVWCLLDCCFSGSFTKKLRSFSSDLLHNDKTYLCITNTTADTVAYDCTYDQWNLSGPFIRAMRSQKTRLDCHRRLITTEHLIADMSYRHAMIDGNLMQCDLIGEYHRIDPQKPFPFVIDPCQDRQLTLNFTDNQNDKNMNTDYENNNSMATISTLGDELNYIALVDKNKTQDDKEEQSSSEESSSSSSSSSSNDGSDASSSSSSDESVHEWKQFVHLKKGDYVYAKWSGGFPVIADDNQQQTSKYMFPLYYKATIVSDCNLLSAWNKRNVETPEVELELEYEHEGSYKWKSKCILSLSEDDNNNKNILPYHYFMFDTDELVESHLLLAKHGRYIDSSFLPNGSKVWAIYEDLVYHGTVTASYDLVTEKIVMNSMYYGYTGPFLWVEWDDENGNKDLIPTYHCILDDTEKSSFHHTSKSTKANRKKKMKSPTVESILEFHKEMVQKFTMKDEVDTAIQSQEHEKMTPLVCMMKGLECMGRRLVLGEKRQIVQCYYDGEWYEAMTSCEIPSIEVLSGHLRYLLHGDYYCVQWYNQDGSHSLLPKSLINWSTKEETSLS